MKRSLSLVAMLLAGSSMAALPTVLDTVVHQRWPFNGKVDITFVLSAGDHCDVDMSATWDGQSTPVVLDSSAFLGEGACDHGPGVHEITWDPAKDGLATRTLANFRVTVTPIAKTARRFLYVDFVNHTNCWYATCPTTAQIRDLKFRRDGMLFARVYAGTYTNGLPSAVRAVRICDNPGDASGAGVNTQPTSGLGIDPVEFKLSSDYFISCLFVTRTQMAKLGALGATEDLTSFANKQDELRGTSGAEAEVCWPRTGFHVAAGSRIATIRNSLAGQMPSGWVFDLPTLTQNLLAQRCGDWQHIWWNGGDQNSSAETLTNLCNVSYGWRFHSVSTHPQDFPDNNAYVPGQLGPNTWGLWEPNGIAENQSLDNIGATGVQSVDYSGLDPVGSSAYSAGCYVTGCNPDWGMAPSARVWGSNANSSRRSADSMSFRLVINARNWTGKPL